MTDVGGVIYNVGNIKHKLYGVKKLNIQLMDERYDSLFLFATCSPVLKLIQASTAD